MPLIKSASKSALQKNIKTEMDANPGKSKMKQNLAIAYSTQRRAGKRKKMSKGGMLAQNMLEKHLEGELPQGELSDQGEQMMMNQGGIAPEMSIDPLDGQNPNADAMSEEMTHQKRDNMQPVIREQAYKEGMGHKARNNSPVKGNGLDMEKYARGGLVDKHSSYGNENELLDSVENEIGSRSSKRREEGDETYIQQLIHGPDMRDKQTKHSRIGDDGDIVAAIMRNRGSMGKRTESYGLKDQAYADGGPVGMDNDWDMNSPLHDGSGEMFNPHEEGPELRKWAQGLADGGKVASGPTPQQMFDLRQAQERSKTIDAEMQHGTVDHPSEEDSEDEQIGRMAQEHSAYASGGLVAKIMQGRRSKRVDVRDNPAEFRDEEPKDDFSLSHMTDDSEHGMDDDHLDKGIVAQAMRKRKMSKRSRG